MEALANPQLQLRCLHVAGTNGKGSTTNYLRSILQEAGYQVGTFTSPYLMVHNDRIRINDVYISDEDLLEYANNYVEVWEKYDLSMFEIDMLISVFYFLDKKVDYAVYEVGMGGRLDATNTIMPLVSLISNIGYDHMRILGNTYTEIAREKAGIVKDGVALLTTENKKECLEVFSQICSEHHSPLIQVRIPEAQLIDGKYHYQFADKEIVINTAALYQVANSVLALSAIDYLNKEAVLDIPFSIMKTGIFKAEWKGRFETVSSKPLIILDGAHNIDGVQALCASIKNSSRPLLIVFSALKDKEYEKMLALLEEVADELVVTQFDFYRRASLESLQLHEKIKAFSDYRQAINYVEKKVGDGTIVITGSLYFISEVRRYLTGD